MPNYKRAKEAIVKRRKVGKKIRDMHSFQSHVYKMTKSLLLFFYPRDISYFAGLINVLEETPSRVGHHVTDLHQTVRIFKLS